MLNRKTLTEIFAPSSPPQFIGFAVINILISLTSNGSLWGALGIAIVFLFWYRLDRLWQKKISVGIKTTKEQPQGARGLILLLSRYSAGRIDNKENPKDEIENGIRNLLDKLIDQLTEADFSAIKLQNSNLEPQIKAVDYHMKARTLQEVWLVGSMDSKQTAEILQKYLQFHYGAKIIVHFDPNKFLADDWDYAKFTQITEDIFKQADFRDRSILVDVTGGTKMMSVALAMACIPPQRKMQYIDSQRDWQGNPLAKGDKAPVVIDFDPILYRENK